MNQKNISLGLLLLIFTLTYSTHGYNNYLKGASVLLQTPNDLPSELLSEQNAISGAAYSSNAQLKVESICNTAVELYMTFGNDTIKPFDSCSYTSELLGISNSEFADEVPSCLGDVVDVFCTFDLEREDTVLSRELFDFVVSSIKYCIKVTVDHRVLHTKRH